MKKTSIQEPSNPRNQSKLNFSPRICCWVFLLTSSWPEVGHNSSETWPSRLWAFEVKSWIPFELRGRNHEDWRWQSDRFLLCWRWEGFLWYGKEGIQKFPVFVFFRNNPWLKMVEFHFDFFCPPCKGISRVPRLH